MSETLELIPYETLRWAVSRFNEAGLIMGMELTMRGTKLLH